MKPHCFAVKPALLKNLLPPVLLVAASAAMAAPADPSSWVQSLYNPHLEMAQEQGPLRDALALMPVAGERVFFMATAAFKAALRNDAECVRIQQSCDVDWDFLVDGQDAELTGFALSPFAVNGDRGTLSARFDNMGTPTQVDFVFRLEQGHWRLDDVVNHHDGRPVSVRTLMAQEKF